MKTLRVTLAGALALLLAGCPPPQSRQPPQPQTQKSPVPQQTPPQQPQQSRESQASQAEREAEQAERRAEAAERAAEDAEAAAQAAQAAARDAPSRRTAEAARNQARIARQAAAAARRDADAARREAAADSTAAARASAEAHDRSNEAAARAQAASKAAAEAAGDATLETRAAADAAARAAADARARAQAAREAAEGVRQQAERGRQAASRGAGTAPGQPGRRPGDSKRAADARRAAEAAERQAKAAQDRAEAANRRVRDAEERGDIAAARRARIERDQAGREAAQKRSEAEAWRQAQAEAEQRSGQRPAGPPKRLPGGAERPPGRVPGGQPGDAWRVSRGDNDPRKRLPLPPLPESVGGEGRSFQDCEECPAMTTVRGGSFIMGSPPNEWGRDPSEGPQHRVSIGYDFAVGIYEITKAEYAAFVEQTGHRSSGACLVVDGSARLVRDRRRNWRDPGFPQSPRDPVVCVSWRDAQAYTRWLSRRTGARYRLLSESEWEYAARGGSAASQFWGDNPDGACDYANGADLSAQAWIRTHLAASRNNSVARYYLLPLHECEDGYTATAPVGTFYPNAFGLHDMIANVDEWVQDCWNGNYRGAPANGAPWMRGNCSKRVARSGSWINGTRYNRVAHRDRSDPDFRHFTIGFRVARDL